MEIPSYDLSKEGTLIHLQKSYELVESWIDYDLECLGKSTFQVGSLAKNDLH